MERTGKQDAPDVDVETGNASSNDNEGTTTSLRLLSERIRRSSSMPSKNGSQFPSVNELLRSNYVLSTLKPDFPYTDENKAEIIGSLVVAVVRHLKWKKALDPNLGRLNYCEAYLKNNNELSRCFDDCVKTRDWNPLFDSLRELYYQSSENTRWPLTWLEQKKATELSWKATFEGEAPMALKAHIDKYSVNKVSCENFCAIIQSSGMGKSRLIDQFSKTHIVIPINLRSKGSTGFPPGDTDVVDYFEDAGSNVTRFQSIRLWCYFLTELLTETMHIFTKLESTSAEKLHAFFEDGMRFDRHGKNREEFYENVVSRALEKKHRGPWNDNRLDEALKEFQSTVEIFSKFIGAEQSTRPEAFFSFDEAHYLSRPLRGSEDQTHMRQLSRILAHVNEQPLFAFFISTTAKIASVLSPRDPSASGELMSGELKIIPAFSDMGYDHLAKENKIGSVVLLLTQVVQVPFMANFGRPMWGLCLKNLDDDLKEDVLYFAKTKLLNAENSKPSEITGPQKLACLSQRLALEYNTKNYLHVEQELNQVECHLRVLFEIGESAESIATVSPSEPLVAEAAALAMKKFNAAEAMKSTLENFSISQGDRGELLVMLLLILARDAAIAQGPPILRIPQLIRTLFTQADLVLDMQPTISPNGSTPSFKDMFKNAGTHFSHFTKVQGHRLYTVYELLALMFRGAFVLCAPGTRGIDLCGGGVLDINDEIKKANSFLLIWQIKNDPEFTDEPKEFLFNNMDPVKLGILSEDDAKLNIPVIRIVFALASPNSKLIPMPPRLNSDTELTCYDLWCAGLTPDVLLPVGNNTDIWSSLLKSSRQWGDLYTEAGELAEPLRRQQNPGVSKESDHWDQWIQSKEIPNSQQKQTKIEER